MNGFFSSDRNKAFVIGAIVLFGSVYVKDRFPVSDEHIKAFAELVGFWIVGRSIRAPKVAA